MTPDQIAALRTLLGRDDVIAAVEQPLNDCLPRVHRMPTSAVKAALAAVLEWAERELAGALPAAESNLAAFQRGWREGAHWRNQVHAEQATRHRGGGDCPYCAVGLGDYCPFHDPDTGESR